MFLMKEHVGKLISDLGELIYRDVRPIEEYRMMRMADGKPDLKHLDPEAFEVLKSKDLWGGHREYFCFETTVTIPQEWDGCAVVYELRTGREEAWDALNPQFLAFVNGSARAGLDVNHRTILLSDCAAGGAQYKILLSAFSGDNNFSLHMDSEIKVLERETEGLYYDLNVPYQVARLLPESDENRRLIVQTLDQALRLVDLRRVYSQAYYDSVTAARAWLKANFYEKYGNAQKEPVVYCVGHTHIDVAWLWTLGVTRDKAVRSFSTVMELMDQYPEYIFMSSQPQLYQYVKEDAPELYEKIKSRIREGRWEAEGGMWLEADCNLSSGEALVRQFLYGIRFFEKEFGVTNKILWLPDVFGYSAALPQIMKLCNIEYFMTTKISWNERNKMPYDTFLWEGIDGTKILTHFVPSRDYGTGAEEGSVRTGHYTTYNADLNASQVMGGWQRYSQKDLNQEVLMSYGFGDGGGGPTKEMIENQRRLAQGIPGSPRTVQATSREFFELLDQHVKDREELPLWVGELYLEYHRGTYTSMARNKRYNRRSEFACENLELLGMMAQSAHAGDYPEQQLHDEWTVLLRNQFHDILPGSAIQEVYEESKEEYEKLLGDNLAEQKVLREAIAGQIDAPQDTVVIFNPNSTSACAPVMLPKEAEGRVLEADGVRLPVQSTADGPIAVVGGIPSKGYRTFGLADWPADEAAGHASESVQIDERGVETPYFVISWDENGRFTRLYDKKADREVLPEGQKANVILSYEDRPHNFDAWDINHYYKEKSWEVNQDVQIEVIERGPVRAGVKFTYHYLDSELVQYVSFYRDLYQFDIRNEIDWNEKQILLRAYFPVEIHAQEATYEIQYGNVTRPTHMNTSWDDARFEVCAHKWIDFGEDGYGVSVLNDCKYGCDVHQGTIGLTMLKSGIYPNPAADKEHHTFTWSFCPHVGSWKQAGTVAKAYALNNPYQAVYKREAGGSAPGSWSLVQTDADNVVIEVVKKAEEGSGTIVRLYECMNRRGRVRLTFGIPVQRAVLTNLLEQELEALAVEDGKVTISVKPYEIKTLCLT